MMTGKKISLMLLSLLVTVLSLRQNPLIITSREMLDHQPSSLHPECPERLLFSIEKIEHMREQGLIRQQEPKACLDETEYNKALNIIQTVHSIDYVNEIKMLCERGARMASPWDSDTYLSQGSFRTTVVAQSAWLDAVDQVINKQSMSFAITRPPGHHAMRSNSMGFCLFNFAVGAATYAMEKYKIKRVGILDFDVHYGNGIADLIKTNPNIRYSSMHQADIFPYGRGKVEETGDHQNILNVPLPYGAVGDNYIPLFETRVLPFLKEFKPELLIVSAGYDAMSTDETAELQLRPKDYNEIARLLKENFGSAIMFGLEGGYDLNDLPLGIEQTILPFTQA